MRYLVLVSDSQCLFASKETASKTHMTDLKLNKNYFVSQMYLTQTVFWIFRRHAMILKHSYDMHALNNGGWESLSFNYVCAFLLIYTPLTNTKHAGPGKCHIKRCFTSKIWNTVLSLIICSKRIFLSGIVRHIQTMSFLWKYFVNQ